MRERVRILAGALCVIALSGCPKHPADDPGLARFAGEWVNDVDPDGPRPEWHWRLEHEGAELVCVCVYDADVFDMSAGEERVEIRFARRGSRLAGKKMIGPNKWTRVEGTPSADGNRIAMRTWGSKGEIHEWAIRRR